MSKSNTTPKWLKLAFKIGWMRSKTFCRLYLSDFQQIAFVAALDAEKMDYTSAARHINKIIYRSIRNYGFYYPTNCNYMVSDLIPFERDDSITTHDFTIRNLHQPKLSKNKPKRKKQQGIARNKGGRPCIQVDYELVQQIISGIKNDQELAQKLGMHRNTLLKLKKTDAEFQKIYKDFRIRE